MKIVLIHGQDHKGSTWHVADELLKSITVPYETEAFFLPKDLNHFCTGCYACLKSRACCPFWKDKEQIDRALKAADLLIFTTPTYCMMPSAPMKALIDLFFTNWMSHKPRKEMFSKRAVVISTAAGASANRAVKPIVNTLSNWGVPKIYKYALAVRATGWATIPEKKKASILKRVKTLGKKLSVENRPRVGIKTRLRFRLFAGMQKANWGASPEEKRYWQEQGWLSGKKPWKNG